MVLFDLVMLLYVKVIGTKIGLATIGSMALKLYRDL